MTPTLATVRFESAYLLCHVNAINAHPMRIQFDLLQMHIETGLRASCKRALRVSPVQQVANNLVQEHKEYGFQLQKSFCEPHDLEVSMDTFIKNPPQKWTELCSYMFKKKSSRSTENWYSVFDFPLMAKNLHLSMSWWLKQGMAWHDQKSLWLLLIIMKYVPATTQSEGLTWTLLNA